MVSRTLSLLNEYTCILISLYVFQDNVLIKKWKLWPGFVYFPIIYLQRMKAIIFILVAATILSACDGCSSYLKKNWCHCFCSDTYSSCRNGCNSFGSSLLGIVCLNQCVKHYSSCSRNCWRKQGWFRIGLNIYKGKGSTDKKWSNDEIFNKLSIKRF